jgi:diguanylate cyclase (GGDEF)-like protein/PAS domain S-box-containing protein
MTDANGHIEYANPAFEEYTGLRLEQLQDRNVESLETEDRAGVFFRNISKIVGYSEPFRSLFVHHDKNDKLTHIEQTVTPVNDGNGTTVRYVSVAKNDTQRVEKEKELKLRAATDILTGLINRWSFDEVLREEMARARRHSRPLSLIMLDIDDFKLINDRHGHDVGDDVLVQLCDVLRGNLRAGDHFARWGGEEFMILTPETDLTQARVLANKLRQTLKRTRFPDIGTVSASFGVIDVKPGQPVKTLLKRVDRLLYKAKEQGRDCVIIADEPDQ